MIFLQYRKIKCMKKFQIGQNNTLTISHTQTK